MGWILIGCDGVRKCIMMYVGWARGGMREGCGVVGGGLLRDGRLDGSKENCCWSRK